MSPSTVSNLNKKIYAKIEAWRNRRIEGWRAAACNQSPAGASDTYGCTAIAEISIFTSRGKRATSTVARAGGALLKKVA